MRRLNIAQKKWLRKRFITAALLILKPTLSWNMLLKSTTTAANPSNKHPSKKYCIAAPANCLQNTSMLIALTLLEDHFDSLLLERNQNTWDTKDHYFLPTTSLTQLYKKWHHHTRHIVIGLNHHYCRFHQFNISQNLSDHEIKKYIALNSKKFFKQEARHLLFDFERHNLNQEFDKIRCIAGSKKLLCCMIKHFNKIGFRIQLIDFNVNALIRGLLQQRKPSEQHFAISEQHQNGSHTYTHNINIPNNKIEKIYCVNTSPKLSAATEIITHQPGSLTTYGLALNAHLDRH